METRSRSHRAAYDHIIKVLLECDDDSPITKSLKREGIEDYASLVSLKVDRIEGLGYNGGKGIVPLREGERGLLRAIIYYRMYQQDAGNKMSPVDWTGIDREQLDDFRISRDYDDYNNAGPTTPRKPPPPPVVKAKRPVDEFRKSIKRDSSVYTVLKDQKQWDKWHLNFVSWASTQGFDNVLDDTYVPFDADEQELFDEQQKWMFAVFNKNLQTDMGITIVQKYKATKDAQSIYAEYLAYSSKSTQGKISSSTILTYLTTSKLGDGKWNGSYEGFILHWFDQLRQFHEMKGASGHLADEIVKTMIENAVHEIPDLRQVKSQADHFELQGRAIGLEGYKSLLQAAAIELDSARDPSKFAKANRKKHSTNRTVYNMETNVHDLLYGEVQDDDSQGDVDYLVLKASSDPKARVPRETWGQLSAEDRQAWDKLSDGAKAKLLQANARPNGTQKDVPHRRVNVHDSTVDVADIADDDPRDNGNIAADDAKDEEPDILVNATKCAHHPGSINRVLSKKLNPPTRKANKHEVQIDGVTYRQVNTHRVTYDVSERTSHQKRGGSLMDRGANGGVAGNDVRIISKCDDHRVVDISGLDDHRVTDIPLVTAGGVVQTQRGPVILIMNQYAGLGRGRTIHAPGQWEYFENKVNDRSTVVGGTQMVEMLDGYRIPMDYVKGLPNIDIRPFTDQEWDELPHVVATGDVTWDPGVLDNILSSDEEWFDAQPTHPDGVHNETFDLQGDYQHRTVADTELFFMDPLEGEEDDPTAAVDRILLASIHERDIKVKERDWEKLAPCFAWVSADRIKETFRRTTQFARMPVGTLKKRFKSPFPAANVARRAEGVATDSVFADTPAFVTGETAAQLFVGESTLFTDGYGMKTDKEFVNTLEDNIRKRGAMEKLISDRGSAEVSKRVKDILRNMVIRDWQSQPHHQHQNRAERHYQTIKRMTNRTMDRLGVPAGGWLLCMLWVISVFNILSNPALGGATPYEALTNQVADISPWLYYSFWDKVYYRAEDPGYPSESTEKIGRFVGVSENVGNHMTFLVLTPDFKHILHRSDIRLADGSNKRADILNDNEDDIQKFVRSASDEIKTDEGVTDPPMYHFDPSIDPSDYVGRTFLGKEESDGTRMRLRIVEAIADGETELSSDPTHHKFRVRHDDSDWEDLVTYQEILSHLKQEEDDDRVWKFRRIVAHEGPLARNHAHYHGSRYNVRIEWENGEVTSEPLDIIAKDDPVTCALYAEENNLLGEDSWKRFRKLAKRKKKMLREANQAKLKSYRNGPKYKYGYEVPRNYNDAVCIDRKNGNTKWQDAVTLEFKQLHEYGTFEDKGLKGEPPPGYKKIRLHIVFDVKHDGRHKARVVANGNLTDPPIESVYSGVVSLRDLRIVIFLAELNGLEIWTTDIGNAYLEAYTKEKVYVVAGPEFGELEGHVLVISRALYGLCSSGKRWHERLADCLREMKFVPSKGAPNVWMKHRGDHYEYVAVCVDDLAIASRDPKAITDMLETKYRFKLKGTGPISFHLGCDFERDKDGVLCMKPKKYINKLLDAYETVFGERAHNARIRSPLERGDHPELDESIELDADGRAKFQSLIGSLQWAISLGRWDIMTGVMSLSTFLVAPREGHLNRAKRVCCYLANFKDAAIRFRTNEPDYSMLPDPEYGWDRSVYGEVREEIPNDAPEPLGNYVTTTSYMDANLYHCMLTGRAVTGVMHLLNQTPIEAYSKKQSTVETSTYGAEFLAGRTCFEQLMDIRLSLRYLGVPIREKSYVFGDNESMINGGSVPDAKLHKRHVALSWHRVREALSSGAYLLYHIDGRLNPADVLSKHWGYQQVYRLLRPLFYYEGDTGEISDDF